MKKLAAVLKALSDETRLSMMELLQRRGELCVCDFVHTLEITQSKASRHLRYLLNAGLLKDRRQGTWMYYRLDYDKAPLPLLKAIGKLTDDETAAELERRLDAWYAETPDEFDRCGDSPRKKKGKSKRTRRR